MRRTVAIDPAGGAVLLTDNASSYPNGLTLINTSQTVSVYLGADSFVTSDDGVPLPPGMSVPWNTDNSQLYACVKDDGGAGQIMLTDNIAPLTGQIPPSIVPDVWGFASQEVPWHATAVGTSTTPHLSGPTTAEFLFNITATTGLTNGTQLGLIGTISGAFTSVASAGTTPAGGSWQGDVTGVAIPYGGYQIGLKNASSTSATLVISGSVTLVRQS